MIVAISAFLVQTVVCLVPFFLAVKACLLDFDITQGYLVAVALVAAYPIFLEFSWLINA